jgi:hypothetical protein
MAVVLRILSGSKVGIETGSLSEPVFGRPPCLSQRAASVPKALPNHFRTLPAFAVTISPIIRLLA